MRPEATAGGYADVRPLLRDALELLRPSRRISVADCAAQHRMLSNEGGGYVGRWRHDKVPYLVEPMNEMTSRTKLVVCVVGPGQSAKTSIFENLLLHGFLYEPRDVLWFMHTEEELDHYTRVRAAGLIDQHRDQLHIIENNQFTKATPRMRVTWFPANNATLISKPTPVLLLDEIDAYKKGLGDVVTKARVRVQTFGPSGKIGVVSHPDRADSTGIAAVYEMSDQRRWFMPCPGCGEWSAALGSVHQGQAPAVRAFELLTGAERAETCLTRSALAALLPEIRAAAALKCPCCGAVIEEPARLPMVRAGKWVGAGQDIDAAGIVTGALRATDTAGFHIAGVMSPFVTLADLAQGLATARWEFKHEGDDAQLREVTSKRIGQLYNRAVATGQIIVGDADLEQQQQVATWKQRSVPDGVRFLTASVDIQWNRFAITVLGWGVAAECWLVDRFDIAQLPGFENIRPAEVPGHWDTLLELFVRGYALAAAEHFELPLACIAIDTGGEPGVTDNAKSFGRRVLAAGVPGYRLMLVKGASSPKADPLPKAPTFEADDTGKRIKAAAPLYVLGVDRIKRVLDTRRARSAQPNAAGPGVLHLPSDLDPRYRRELVAEQLDGDTWTVSGANETWDGWVYGEAARLHLRPDRAEIDWQHPPAWAARRPRNTGGPAPQTTPANAVRPNRPRRIGGWKH
jgi:phage terminase large subunit GpA-like protein